LTTNARRPKRERLTRILDELRALGYGRDYDAVRRYRLLPVSKTCLVRFDTKEDQHEVRATLRPTNAPLGMRQFEIDGP